MMNPSGYGGRRAFLVFDEEGELNGNFGYWAEDGAEEFLDAFKEDVKKKTRKGKGIGRKGKGRSGRRIFRPRNKGKGKGKRKGKNHTLQKMRAIGLMMNGKGTRQRTGMNEG